MQKPILYYSTNQKAEKVAFKEALLKGIAPDGGLYMPERIPVVSREELDSFSEIPYHQIAFIVGEKFLGEQIPDADLQAITKDAYNYEVPLERVIHQQYVLRLDQGPTASFKDFAARMMGRLMQYYLKQENRNLTILTATSGDTGSAIANAFYGLDNIQVVILFPEKEVTARQRKQMTTLGKNVQILAIDGKFDDCQAMVKTAFADPELDALHLSSANSINIGRLIPQTMYYFYSFARLRAGDENDQVIFSVPSGNFGDLMGGIFAKHMGLPVKRFIVSTNENDEVPQFLETGVYEKIEPSRNCISSAMNVGHPSNLARIVDIYGGIMDEKGQISKMPDMKRLRADLYAISISDIQTKTTIKSAYDDHQLLLEPHGSVGWAGLIDYLKNHPTDDNPEQLCISLETAHPAKFPEQIREILDLDPLLPPSLEGIEEKKESFEIIENRYDAFKQFLKNKY